MLRRGQNQHGLTNVNPVHFYKPVPAQMVRTNVQKQEKLQAGTNKQINLGWKGTKNGGDTNG